MEEVLPMLMPYLMVAAGVFAGAVATWFTLRLRAGQELQRVKGALELEQATIHERLSGREQQLRELRDALDRE